MTLPPVCRLPKCSHHLWDWEGSQEYHRGDLGEGSSLIMGMKLRPPSSSGRGILGEAMGTEVGAPPRTKEINYHGKQDATSDSEGWDEGMW
jgi:hypothetical protein